MNGVISFALDISECVQYIRHIHLMSFGVVMPDPDVFKMIEIVSFNFTEDFSSPDFVTEFYAEARTLIMNQYVKTEQDKQTLYGMFNFLHHQLKNQILSLGVVTDGQFNYRLDTMTVETFAVYFLIPY